MILTSYFYVIFIEALSKKMCLEILLLLTDGMKTEAAPFLADYDYCDLGQPGLAKSESMESANS